MDILVSDQIMNQKYKINPLLLTAKIQIEREEIKRGGFMAFIERAWSHVDRAKFINNWHIIEMANVLEQIAIERYEGIGRELTICVPPASTKSRIASILWQPWIWTWWPSLTFISCTYEGGPGSVALKHSKLSRDLVQSRWYQRMWPLKLDKAGESYWTNELGGCREAVGTGMAVTGDHYHIHLGDDLVPEQMSRVGTPAAIAKALEKANGFWWSTLATREKELGRTARVMIGQRLHQDDPPGKAMEKGYESIVFPAHYNSSRADPRDHREVDGALLCPERADENYYRKKAEELGPAGAAAQLEQNPVPPGGKLIEDEYLSHRYNVLPARIAHTIETGEVLKGQTWITSWDLAFKGKDTSDWVVGQLWCRYEAGFYLIDQVRNQIGFKMSKQVFRNFTEKYHWVRKHLVEDAANASALEDDLCNEIPGIVLEPHGGGCLARIQLIEGILESGRLFIPESAPWLGGGDGFIAEMSGFDGLGTRHDDQVAALGLALVHLSDRRKKTYADKWRKVSI